MSTARRADAETAQAPTRREVITYAGLGIVASAAYFTICRTTQAPVEVVMPTWVPFFPWLAIPYLLQLVVSFFLVLALRDPAVRRACVSAYFSSYAVICLIWLRYPTIMHRPTVPHGWWNWPYQAMAALDLPVSIVPAGHILMPVIVCWAFAVERPRALWWLLSFEALGTIAIVTTWQHRPVDVAIGAVIAAVCGWLFGVGRRRFASPARASDSPPHP